VVRRPTHPEDRRRQDGRGREDSTRRGRHNQRVHVDDEPGLVRFGESLAGATGEGSSPRIPASLGEYVVSDYPRAGRENARAPEQDFRSPTSKSPLQTAEGSAMGTSSI